jgi:hypothetical protein
MLWQISQANITIGQVASCLSFFIDCTKQSLQVTKDKFSQFTIAEFVQLVGMDLAVNMILKYIWSGL